MWYVALSKAERLNKTMPRSAPWRVAYAESDDGIKWTKPNLRLVESGGNTDNNLVKLDPHIGVLNLKVLHEPDNPKLPEANTVIPPLHFEPVGGLYKWDGLYHVSGQNAIVSARPYHGRVSRTFVSPDFANWTQSSAIQIVCDAQHHLLGAGRSREGEQTHEGISAWNRGNVLIGISGIWHGTPEWKDLTIDLGFVVSNDGIRFREPAHEHIFLKRGGDGDWDQGGLIQGQGFENVGEQTYIFYGAWDPRTWQSSPPRGGVGIATLPRDRFADFVTDETTKGKGDYQMPVYRIGFPPNSQSEPLRHEISSATPWRPCFLDLVRPARYPCC